MVSVPPGTELATGTPREGQAHRLPDQTVRLCRTPDVSV